MLRKVLLLPKKETVTAHAKAMATAADFGDYLLNKGEVIRKEYDMKQTDVSEPLGV